MPRSLSWYHDMWANTLLESMQMRHFCVTGTFTKHSTGLCGICFFFFFFFFQMRLFHEVNLLRVHRGSPPHPCFPLIIILSTAFPYARRREREGCCHLCEPRQYIQPRLASYDWGKCGPDTLPFTGRQRLHYANVTTRGKESERGRERERGKKSEQTRECEEESSE